MWLAASFKKVGESCLYPLMVKLTCMASCHDERHAQDAYNQRRIGRILAEDVPEHGQPDQKYTLTRTSRL
jgi:hypothetical protein